MRDLIYLKPEIFDGDGTVAEILYETSAKEQFDTFEDFKEFYLEVANNHPDGIDLEYFRQLVMYYTSNKAIASLLEMGLIEEVELEDGTIAYRLFGS